MDGDETTVETAVGLLRARGRHPVGARVLVAVRPERIALGRGDGESRNVVALTVRDPVFLGSKLILHFDAAAGDRAVAELPSTIATKLAAGDLADVHWSVADTMVFPVA
jgi:ABC-type Fe3+/spermidine/putrescine transport system ATPase subunit